MTQKGATSDRARVRAEAAAWIARLQGEDRTTADEAGFRRWLDRDPRHQEAFNELTLVWELSGSLGSPAPATPAARSVVARKTPFPALIAACCALVVVAAAAATGWLMLDRGAAYASAPGETRRIALADGSAVILDSNSSIRVRLTPGRRDLRLVHGRAHFDVAKDKHRPFVVTAGDRQVFALGTKFDVDRAPGFTSVVLVEGRVAVQATRLLGSAGEPRIMAPGERLTFRSDGSAVEDRPNLLKLNGWQTGRAVFDNDTLAVAAAELNRYSRRPIVIRDPAVSRMRVSGEFRAGATEDFAVSVQALLPVRTQLEPSQIVLESRLPAS